MIDDLVRLYSKVYLKIAIKFFLAMTVQLEYITHLLQFFKNISYYAGIILNAFSDQCINNNGTISWFL